MKDIPIFSGCGGISTLILREIPYKKTAFIMVRTWESSGLEDHLAQAAELCRFAGAERIYAAADSGSISPSREPNYKMLSMATELKPLPDHLPYPGLTRQALDPDCMDEYISLYNLCFSQLTSAITFTAQLASEAVDDPHRQCFLYRLNGKPAAVSDLSVDSSARLNAIGVAPSFRGGLGMAIMKSIMADAAEGGCSKLCVSVMSTNLPALRLYEKLGFKPDGQEICWYTIGK